MSGYLPNTKSGRVRLGRVILQTHFRDDWTRLQSKFDFSVFEIIDFIALVYFAQYPARVSHGDDSARNIFGNHAASADYAAVAYAYARKNNRARAYPAVSAYSHRKIILINLFSQLRQNGVGRR